MGKYDAKKQKKKKSSQLTVWLVSICCIALPVAVIAISWALRDRPAEKPIPSTPAVTTPSVLVPTFPTIPDTTTVPDEPAPQYPSLGANLTIDYIGSYAGIYMEDGSDEIVSNMLMLIVKNTGTQDLQLARITLQYSSFLADFEVKRWCCWSATATNTSTKCPLPVWQRIWSSSRSPWVCRRTLCPCPAVTATWK